MRGRTNMAAGGSQTYSIVNEYLPRYDGPDSASAGEIVEFINSFRMNDAEFVTLNGTSIPYFTDTVSDGYRVLFVMPASDLTIK